jgi:hypothetical protein
MSTKDGYKKIYDFLIAKHKENTKFSIDEISIFTGLKQSTLKVYIRNKLKNKYLEPNGTNYYVTDLIQTISENVFINFLCQKNIFEKNNTDISDKLLLNSKNALFAAIEIHNKPLFSYRYQVVVILVINAWELLLKAYLSKYMKVVKILKDDGTTKSFDECVKCVFENLGKNHFIYRDNLLLLYDYRCKYIHFYYEGMDLILFSLIQKSVLLYAKFIHSYFNCDISDIDNLYILPIGFTKPISPIDYITSISSIKDVPSEVKEFILKIFDKTESLAKSGIDETLIVPYSIHYKSEHRLTNADIVAAINTNRNVNISVMEKVQFTDDPNAKKVRIDEDSVYISIYTETYNDIYTFCKYNIPGFKQNAIFHSFMKNIKLDPDLHRKRPLNLKNPEGTGQDFYSKQVYAKMLKLYKIDKEDF